MQFTPVLALYEPFGVDVPLKFDITHSLTGLASITIKITFCQLHLFWGGNKAVN